MDSKLTLKLNAGAIARAKAYAEKKNTSLSKMVEDYFNLLAAEPRVRQISPLVRELSGIITLEPGYDHKDSYAGYLVEKYK